MTIARLARTTAFLLSTLALPRLAHASEDPCGDAADACLANAQSPAEVAACDEDFLACSECVETAELCFEDIETEAEFFACDAEYRACFEDGQPGDEPFTTEDCAPPASIELAFNSLNDFYVRTPSGMWAAITNDHLSVYFGPTLTAVNVTITRMFGLNSGGTSTWWLAVDDLADGLPDFLLSGTRSISYSLARPLASSSYQVEMEVLNGRPLPSPDLVLEPQTGCPPDTGEQPQW